MSKTPWTPAPWEVFVGQDDAGHLIKVYAGAEKAGDIWRQCVCTVWTDEHDARLIAAAPEYDELLGEAIDIFEGDLTGVEWKRAWRDFTHRAKALRAKARGDQ